MSHFSFMSRIGLIPVTPPHYCHTNLITVTRTKNEWVSQTNTTFSRYLARMARGILHY